MSDYEQGSAKWFELRCGKITASRLSDAMSFKRDGQPSRARQDYLAELVAERLSGIPYPHVVTDAMRYGIDTEPYARTNYEVNCGVAVELVGFVQHPEISGSGGSPDGLAGADGMIEIKCPNTATHIQTLRTGEIDDKYLAQMQWNMECTGRKWCDFVSYDPRIGLEHRLMFVKRVARDDAFIAAAREQVEAALAEIAETVEWLRQGAGA